MSAQAAPVLPTTPPFRTQLARTPLIPEAVLKRHGAYCVIDTRFRATARLLTCLYFSDRNIPTMASHGRAITDGAPAFGSILSPEAADEGRNFLSPATFRRALEEWILCENDAAFDGERLCSNGLSSMPLLMNLFAPMAADRALATAVFRRLLPGVVESVHRFAFEHSCGRGNERFLADRTAWDLAVHYTGTSGQPGIIYCELKYSESLDSNPARVRPRYAEASREVGLYNDPDSLILRATPIEQLWREHMLAALAVREKVTPRAIFLAIAPQLNRRVQAAFRVYQGELIEADPTDPSHVPFVPLTLERVIDAIAAAGATDLAAGLWHRYCDFERVYRLAIDEMAGDAAVKTGQSAASRTMRTSVLPPARRRRASRGSPASAMATGRRAARSRAQEVR